MSISRSVMKKLATVSALGLGAALFQGDAAKADTATAVLSVDATVVEGCVITTSPVSFGNYNALAATPTTAQGGITVTCPTGTAWEVLLGQGVQPATGSSDANPARQMANGANRLGYGLFTDTAHSVNWANATGAGVTGTGDGTAHTTPVYGSIPAGQNVPAGAYTDSVIATINY